MARYSVQMTFETPSVSEEFAHGRRLGRGGQMINMLGSEGGVAVAAVVSADSTAEAADEVTRHVYEIWARHGRGPLNLVSWTARRIRLATSGRRGRASGGPFWTGGPFMGPDDDEGGTAGVREPRRPLPAPPSLSVELPIPGSPEAVA